MAALGRVIEDAAYPTVGAAAGSLAGPGGAAAGAAAGHFVGNAVSHEAEPRVFVGGGGDPVVILPQPGDFFTATWLILPNWAWVFIVGYLLHRIPWLPRWIWDQVQRKRAAREAPD